MERLPALSSDDFTMNDQDIVRVRNQTSGIWETSFVLDRYTFRSANKQAHKRSLTPSLSYSFIQPPPSQYFFRIVDVGGQRQERHKWIQCFSGRVVDERQSREHHVCLLSLLLMGLNLPPMLFPPQM